MNSIALACRKAGESFPASIEALGALKDGRRAVLEQRRAESTAALEAKLAAAEHAAQQARAEAMAASAEAAALREQLDIASARTAQQAEQIGALRAQVEDCGVLL